MTTCVRASLLGLCGTAVVGTLLVMDARLLLTLGAPGGSLRGGRRLDGTTEQIGSALQEHGSNLGGALQEHGGHLADKAWEHGSNLGNKAWEHGSDFAGHHWDKRHEYADKIGEHASNVGNAAYEHGSKWAGKAYEHGSDFANHHWEKRHEYADAAYEHGSAFAGKAYEHGSYAAGKAWEHGGRLANHIANNPHQYAHHFANHGWVMTNPALWPFAFLDGFPAAWKAAILVLQAIFAIIYYMVVVQNYPFWMGPSSISSQMQVQMAPCATLQASPANLCLSFLCPQARAAHTFDRTGTIEYWCGLVAMFLCPFCTLCYTNACMDLNPKLGGSQANAIMSALCTWGCACCVIAQDAESLDAATGARTELCGVTEGMNPLSPMGYGQMGPMGGHPGLPAQMMMQQPHMSMSQTRPYY